MLFRSTTQFGAQAVDRHAGTPLRATTSSRSRASETCSAASTGSVSVAPLRAALLTAEGRAMRMSVQAEREAGFRRALAGATAGLTPKERQRVLAVIQLLYSGYAWLSMRDHWGLDGKEAGEAALWAVRTLLESLHAHGAKQVHRKEKRKGA